MPHKHTYDEHGLCFECDKPKPSRAEDNKRLRQRRKDAGLVQFRCWCTPEEKKAIELALKDIRASGAYGPVIEALK